MKEEPLSLRQAKKVLRQGVNFLTSRRWQRRLPDSIQTSLKELLHGLHQAIDQKDRDLANLLARRATTFYHIHCQARWLHRIWYNVESIGIALMAAFLIRQMAFELYEIPSGSMRPTLEEQDRLWVSKTTFGVNVPFLAKQLWFNPDSVQREDVVVFTSRNMNIPDQDTKYFGVFPGKKQYIKRVVGKPGDVLYFYGGHVYCVDASGVASVDGKSGFFIEHVPFIDFDRKRTQTLSSSGDWQVHILQMDQPVVSFTILRQGQLQGQVLTPQNIHVAGEPPFTAYSDMWGIKNYGMSLLLSKEELAAYLPGPAKQVAETDSYLVVRHHPSVEGAVMHQNRFGVNIPFLKEQVSVLPISTKVLNRIWEQMYTARFYVHNDHAYRYGSKLNEYSISLSRHIPDGCYEIQNGVAYRIGYLGVRTSLPEEHPLMHFEAAWVRLFYNMGMEWDTRFGYGKLTPSRYAYFNQEDFYLLGAPILSKEDCGQVQWVHNNAEIPFCDEGPPVTQEGEIDVDLIRRYGLLVPEGSYLVLGDNHAMSADSREFGFVPEGNLRGSPAFLFWPFGSRLGSVPQPHHSIWTLPNIAIWGTLVLLLSWMGTRWYYKKESFSKALKTLGK